jgi:HSP20 family protein
MALVRVDPAVEVDSLQSEVNRMFDSFFGGRPNGGARRWIPPMDLAETDGELVLTADLPGVDEDEISIEVKDRVLTISGERSDSREERDRGYHRIERSFGRFSRSLTLPEGIDADRVVASFDRGVLEVRIPKPEERKPHRVEIGSGPIEGKATEQD